MDDRSNNELYVGNLDYEVVEDDLYALFSGIGEVESAKVIKHHETGRSRGFGFVAMKLGADAKKAMEKFAGTEFKGRTMVIREARPRE